MTRRVRALGVTADPRRGPGQIGRAAWRSPEKVDQAALNRFLTAPWSKWQDARPYSREVLVRTQEGQSSGAAAALTAASPGSATQGLVPRAVTVLEHIANFLLIFQRTALRRPVPSTMDWSHERAFPRSASRRYRRPV